MADNPNYNPEDIQSLRNVQMPRRRRGPSLRLSDSGRRWAESDRQFYDPAQDTPPLSVQQTIERMPNYEKLTPSEKWIYGKLPAVTGFGVGEYTVGKALEWFSESWVGKALTYLDVGAELLERSAGMASQYLFSLTEPDGGEGFRNNLADAWYAGGLSADMMNLPKLRRDEDGNVTGIAFPTDLPGIGGVVEARRKISMLADQGVDRGEALRMVREDYYNDLGALQLRAQMYDMFVHIAGDPINYVNPLLKPIEKINKAGKIAASKRLIPGSLDELADLAKVAKAEGRLEDAATIASRIEHLKETSQTMSFWDKTALFLSGGNPLDPNWIAKQRWNLASLTPEARAYEYVTVATDHIGTHIISNPRLSDPVDIVNAIERASRGALGPEFGHAFLSVEGRSVQGLLGLVDTQAKARLDDWIKIRPERQLLNTIADALDDNPANIINLLKEGPETVGAKLTQLGDEGVELASRLTDDVVENLKTLEGLPYTDELFRHYLNQDIIDIAAKQGVIQFGVKSRGLIGKIAYSVKAAETLAFLRLNPGFAARNFVNNEFTMLARGVGGVVPEGKIDELVDIIGFEPYRMAQAYSMSGEPALMGAEVTDAGRAIADALRGQEGFLSKAQKWMQDIELPEFLDMGAMSTRAEASASRRAFYKGYMQGWRQYFWKPGKGFDAIRDAIEPQVAARIGDDVLNSVEDTISGAFKMDDVDSRLRGNLNLAPRSVLDDAAEELGVPLERVMQPEFISRVEQELPAALEKGPEAVRDLFSDLRKQQSNHIKELTEAAHDARIAYFENLVGSEGPSGLLMAWGDMTDEFAGSHGAHFMRMERINAGEIDWADEFAQSSEYFERAWQRFDDGLTGMKQGAEKLGFSVPDEVTDSFTQWRTGWQDFHSWKRDLYEDFFSTPRAERELSFADIRTQVSERYEQMVDVERQLTMTMDDRITAMVREANPHMADAFAAWRARSAEIRDADKQAVIDFFNQIEGVSPAERSRLFIEFHRERFGRWQDLWRNERAGISMLQGDPVAREALERMSPFAGNSQQVRTIANRYGIPSATEEGVPFDQRIVNTVNKYLEGRYEELAGRVGLLPDDFTTNPSEFVADDFLPIDAEDLKLYHVTTAKDEVLEQGLRPRAETGSVGLGGGVDNQAPNLISTSFDEAAVYSIRDRLELASRATRGDADLDDVISHFENVYRDDNALFEVISERWGDVEFDGTNYDEVLESLRTDFSTPEELYKLIQELDDEIPAIFETPIESGVYRVGLTGSFDEMKRIDPDQIDILEVGGRIGSNPEHVAGEFELRFDPEDIWVITEEAVEDVQQYTRLEDIPPDVAADAFEARRAFRGEEPPTIPETAGVEIETVPGSSDVLKDSMYPNMDVVEDQLWYQRGYEALDDMERAALDAQAKPPLMWDDLDDEARQAIERYLTRVEGQMGDARYAAIRFGEYKRDAALLNYNRRYNYNTLLSTFMPFEFWMTQSLAKWALHSIDRPAMLTTFLRLRKFIETAGAPQAGFPSRLQNTIRIDMPFLPDWMGGSVYIDPLRMALPFDTMAGMYERYIQDQHRFEGRVERLIQEKMATGAVEVGDGQNALETKTGQVWENTVAEVQANDANDRHDMFDLVNLFSSFHAPIVWAKHAIEGTPEEIGPLMPASRTVNQFFGLFGVSLPNAKYNVWGNVRKELGLPAFDQWDDYRVDRMLSNMAASGEITVDQALRAMINREGEIYDRAASRQAREFAGGGVIPFALKTLGIPTQTYPEGEFLQRELQDDFSRAYEAYDNGDVDALNEFFEEHPEYETRLALWDEPEERLQRFLVDEIWDRYRDMPKVHKDELREQLGNEWQNAFLNKETRNYDAIPVETLQIWLKMMGGDPPGTLTQAVPIDFAPPEIAWRAQVFYDIRNEAFPGWWDIQGDYFKLDKNARREYLKKHPQLKQYWDWRRDFFHRNPEVVPYLTDEFEFQYPSEEVLQQTQQYQPNYTWIEWQYILSPATARVIMRGDIPEESEEYLTDIAQDLGLSYEEMLQRVRAAAGQ